MRKKKSANVNSSIAGNGRNASVSSEPNNTDNDNIRNGGISKTKGKDSSIRSNVVDMVDNEITSEERTVLAYLLRYEVMVKSQEAEDMAVRDHLLPIFEKLSEGRSFLSFAEMHRWGKILSKSTPEENYIVTDSQLTMILETFGSPGMTDGWSLTAFTFCYKFIILGMQTLQHLSRQDETVRQRFKETFFQMLHQYHPENNPSSIMTADDNNDDSLQETQDTKQLLTLKDRQMSKLTLNVRPNDPSKPKHDHKSESESDDEYHFNEEIDGGDQNEENENISDGKDEHFHLQTILRKLTELYKQNNLLFNSFLICLSLCFGFGFVALFTKVNLVSKMQPLLNQYPWMSIEPPMLLPKPVVPKSDANLTGLNSKQNFSSIREYRALNKQLSHSLKKSQNELYEARLQIQSLVMVLTDMQQNHQKSKTMPKKLPPISCDPVENHEVPIFSKVFLISQKAIKFLSVQTSRFVDVLKKVWGRISGATSILFRSNFHS